MKNLPIADSALLTAGMTALGLVFCLLLAKPLPAHALFKQAQATPALAAAPNTQTIIGGQPAEPGEWPWQAVVMVGSRFCGGILIQEQWLLTAAHCLYTRNDQLYAPATLQVILGEYHLDNAEGHEQYHQVDLLIPHPDYDAAIYDNDIALIHLVTPALLNPYVLPIPLLVSPTDDDLIAPDKLVTVIGWGVTNRGVGLSPILQEVALPVVTNATCNQSYGTITANMLCAGYAIGGKDSCQGDSGGPLMAADNQGGWKLAGIVSFGAGCAEPLFYGVYSRVSRYVDWIQQTTALATPAPTTTLTPTTTPPGTAAPTITPLSPTPTVTATSTPTPLVTPDSNDATSSMQSYLPLIYP